MIFSVLLMCFEYRDVLLITRVQPSIRATASWYSEFTGSKYALGIQPSAPELFVNTRICEPCPSCLIVMYIDVVDSRNYNRLIVSFLCHSGRILYCRARLLLL